MKKLLAVVMIIISSTIYGQYGLTVQIDLTENSQDSIGFIFYKMNIQADSSIQYVKASGPIVKEVYSLHHISFPANGDWAVSIVNYTNKKIKYIYIFNSGPVPSTFSVVFKVLFDKKEQLSLEYNSKFGLYEYMIFNL